MDGTPGGVCGCLESSPASPQFTPDEIEVAAALASLQFLIPFRDPRYYDFLAPLWGYKRPRSACLSSVAPSPMCLPPVQPTVTSCPGGGNHRDISPDSPLLLKGSPVSSVDALGSSGIAVDPPREKKAIKKRGCKDGVDVSKGIKISKKKPKKEKMGPRNNVEEDGATEAVDLGLACRGQPGCQLPVLQITGDPSSTRYTLPSGVAWAVSTSPARASRSVLLFDLNMTPPDSPGPQSPLPDERAGEQGLSGGRMLWRQTGGTQRRPG